MCALFCNEHVFLYSIRISAQHVLNILMHPIEGRDPHGNDILVCRGFRAHGQWFDSKCEAHECAEALGKQWSTSSPPFTLEDYV